MADAIATDAGGDAVAWLGCAEVAGVEGVAGAFGIGAEVCGGGLAGAGELAARSPRPTGGEFSGVDGL